MAQPFTRLTPAQTHDPMWRILLKPALTTRLQDLRIELENSNCTAEATASLRGRIGLLKELLALETDPAEAGRRAQRVPTITHPDE